MNFPDLGTLFFFIAAAVIFYQLRNVLGKRTGRERPPFDPYSRREDAGPQNDNVVALPGRKKETPEAAYAVINEVAKPGTKLNKELRAIRDTDPSFDPRQFVDGAKLAYGETQRFQHGNLESLVRLLDRNTSGRGTLIVVDGVYSMEGDIADVPELVRIARHYGAALAVDDAHALGVLGPNGEGTGAHFGMQSEVDLVAGTFSKSLASVGGFVAGREEVIHFLKHHSRPFIFTASLPPANTAGVIAALQVLQDEPERRD